MVLIAKILDQPPDVFADTGSRNISSIILEQERFIAELLAKNANAKCSNIFLSVSR